MFILRIYKNISYVVIWLKGWLEVMHFLGGVYLYLCFWTTMVVGVNMVLHNKCQEFYLGYMFLF